MIVVESKRKKLQTLQKAYPGAEIIDVTSHAEDKFVKLSPFYPNGAIPVPGYPNLTGACVEGIWQGLKVFPGYGIDIPTLKNDTMKNIKRTVRRFGQCLGHKYGDEVLGYIEARKRIYLPAYRWVLENRVSDLIEELRRKSEVEGKTIVLLDYETNSDVENPSKPLSHASLVKAMVENKYPVY